MSSEEWRHSSFIRTWQWHCQCIRHRRTRTRLPSIRTCDSHSCACERRRRTPQNDRDTPDPNCFPRNNLGTHWKASIVKSWSHNFLLTYMYNKIVSTRAMSRSFPSSSYHEGRPRNESSFLPSLPAVCTSNGISQLKQDKRGCGPQKHCRCIVKCGHQPQQDTSVTMKMTPTGKTVERRTISVVERPSSSSPFPVILRALNATG